MRAWKVFFQESILFCLSHLLEKYLVKLEVSAVFE